MDNVVHFFDGIAYVFKQMPASMAICFFVALIAMATSIYIGIISPIIFNYYIIPGIERKVGQQLEDHPFIKNIFLGRWMCRQSEIAVYLINRYYAKVFKNDYGLPQYCIRFGLKKVGYTIGQTSRFELFMCFLLALSYVVVVICGVIVMIMRFFYPQYFQ